MIDIDGFKQVNDVLGHLAGDEVLCALGDALSSRLRSSDRPARLGGDEFAALLIGVDGAEVEHLAATIGAELSAAMTAAQESVRLPVSVGTALLDRRAGGVSEAIEAAAARCPPPRRATRSARKAGAQFCPHASEALLDVLLAPANA